MIVLLIQLFFGKSDIKIDGTYSIQCGCKYSVGVRECTLLLSHSSSIL